MPIQEDQKAKDNRELFKRTKAEYVSINCPENHETSPLYKPIKEDPSRLSGK